MNADKRKPVLSALDINTNLTGSDCMGRVRAGASMLSNEPDNQRNNKIRARTDGKEFWLWVIDTRVSNAFRPVLHGSVDDEPGGSRVRCRFTLHPFAAVFIAVWYAGLAVIECVLLFYALRQHFTGGSYFQVNALVALMVPVLFALCGYSFVRFAGWLSRSDKEALAEFVQNALTGQSAEKLKDAGTKALL